MSAKRDTLFPSGSIGRTPSISRTASHESLPTHPLLSPTPGSPPTTTFAESASGAPRYVPYTPRHRVTPTSATTGTTMQPSMSAAGPQNASHSDATSKLQIMNLKAAAQRIGLDTASTGWAILERLSTETDHGPEWNEIWGALSFSKATLLLPLDNHRSSEPITPEFIKDHIALCDGSGRSNAPIVTLSGLQGTLKDTTLTFRSTLPPASTLFQALLNPAARSSALTALPPLPNPLFQATVAVPPSPSSSTASVQTPPQYPRFNTPSYAPALPIPPRPSVTFKPPLPPRPGARVLSGPANPASRLSNPFASLFGRATPPASPSTAPTPLHSEPNPISLNTSGSSPTGSLSSQPALSPDRTGPAEHSLEVPAFTISTRIDRAALGRSLTDALLGEIRAVLGEAAVPSWAIERVEQFAKPLFPLVHATNTGGKEPSIGKPGSGGDPGGPVARAVSGGGRGRGRGSGEWVIAASPLQERAEDMSNKFQEFYIELEDMLWSRLPKSTRKLRKGHGKGAQHAKEDGGDARPPTLVQLDTVARSPAEKAAVLVSVHKIIVDGLAKLPPIGLKPEDEIIDDGKTPRAKTTFGRYSAEDDNDVEDKELTTTATAVPAANTRAPDPIPEQPVVSPTIVLSPVDVSSASGEWSLPVQATQDASSVSPDLVPPRSASLRSTSPIHTAPSRTSSPTPVSGDVILPLMIFAVVKANPPRLVSNLLYIQRFRRESASGGEEGYCLINLMAVAEFLENVDLVALGLGDSENTVLSPAQLSPIPFARSVRGAQPPSPQAMPASLRGRVEQQVDAITGSANKVLSGVVDSSFGVLRSLLPGQSQTPATATTLAAETTEETSRPGFGILRRDTGFSIASLAASLPGSRASRSGTGEESGQQMIEVPSRPGSSRSMRVPEEEATESEEGTTEEEGDEDEDEEDEEYGHDARSIRSFESMMSGRSRQGKGKRKFIGAGRMSLTDRLASMPGLSRLSQGAQNEAAKASPPGSRRSSLLLPATTTIPTTNRFDTPISSRAASPIAIRVSPPNPHFLSCTEDDIKVSEVGELLREYKRLAEAIRAMGGFHDDA
ncbi:uncharacterized protein C8Q71DRAFT_703402 [Rhodofomes roseus]|uniref:VPS9 domain-containing protein n=1 Tax=Rhodofomes roseus TaxID=34475 RepID=A0ABQ8KNK4_9APHY|nr:uncharacterized protein C8Q71DRAFT_703402 [Rhodofomes roseus]KAH9839997.1 hypothetical protein C8Q71DRAFT_703402 [Rhodofomes roseus]